MREDDPKTNLLKIPRLLCWLGVGLGLLGVVIAPSPFIPPFLWIVPLGFGVWGLLYLQNKPMEAVSGVKWLLGITRRYRLDLLIALLIGVGAFVIYRLTMAPGLVDLERDTLGHINGLQAALPIGSTGYPLYVWAVQFFRLLPHDPANPAFHFNLFSAVFGALSSGLLFLLTTALSQLVTDGDTFSIRQQAFWPWCRRALGAAATFAYIFSPIFWFYNTITEVYTFNIFIILIVLILVALWFKTGRVLHFLGACFFIGLSMGSHITNFLLLPGFALVAVLFFYRREARFRTWLKGLGLFLLGSSQYLWIPFALDFPGDRFGSIVLGYFANWAAEGNFAQRSFAFALSELPGRLATFLSYNLEQFTWVGLILGLAGLVFLWQRHRLLFAFLILAFSAQVVYLTQYAADDWWTYFTVNHLIWALFILMGLLMLAGWLGSKLALLSCLFKRVLLGVVILLFLASLILPVAVRWPMRDISEAVYLDDFFSVAFEMMPPGTELFDMMSVYGYGEAEQVTYYQIYRQDDFGVPAFSISHFRHYQVSDSTAVISSWEELERRLRRQRVVYTPLPPVPVLYGNPSPDRTTVYPLPYVYVSYPLVLFRFPQDFRPFLISEAAPENLRQEPLDNLIWRGYTFDASTLLDQILTLDLFWTVPQPRAYIPATWVTIRVGEQIIGDYPVGQKLLPHYLQVDPTPDPLAFRDPVRMVLPSSLPSGQLPMTIQICVAGGCSEPPILLETIQIP